MNLRGITESLSDSEMKKVKGGKKEEFIGDIPLNPGPDPSNGGSGGSGSSDTCSCLDCQCNGQCPPLFVYDNVTLRGHYVNQTCKVQTSGNGHWLCGCSLSLF